MTQAVLLIDPRDDVAVALSGLAPGDSVAENVAAGDHVHSHNLATSLSGLEDYAYAPAPPRVR